jgi:hypothetical protein
MRTHRLSLTDPAGLGLFTVFAKALAFLPPQTGSVARRDAAVTAVPEKTPVPRRGWFERLEYWFWMQQQRDLEAYLAKATAKRESTRSNATSPFRITDRASHPRHAQSMSPRGMSTPT